MPAPLPAIFGPEVPAGWHRRGSRGVLSDRPGRINPFRPSGMSWF